MNKHSEPLTNMNEEENDAVTIDEDGDEVFSPDKQIPGICYYVIVEHNAEHKDVKQKIKSAKKIEKNSMNNPIGTYKEALDNSDILANKIKKSYKGSEIYQVEDETREDVFHLILIDKNSSDPIVRIGVGSEDYRKVTLH